MTHVREEFGLGSICKFSCFSSDGVPLDTVPQFRDHLIDFSFEFVHFAGGIDSDKLVKIAICSCIRDLSERAYLRSYNILENV